ncbi:hypothetical protein [Ekhidna sp.]
MDYWIGKLDELIWFMIFSTVWYVVFRYRNLIKDYFITTYSKARLPLPEGIQPKNQKIRILMFWFIGFVVMLPIVSFASGGINAKSTWNDLAWIGQWLPDVPLRSEDYLVSWSIILFSLIYASLLYTTSHLFALGIARIWRNQISNENAWNILHVCTSVLWGIPLLAMFCIPLFGTSFIHNLQMIFSILILLTMLAVAGNHQAKKQGNLG